MPPSEATLADEMCITVPTHLVREVPASGVEANDSAQAGDDAPPREDMLSQVSVTLVMVYMMVNCKTAEQWVSAWLWTVAGLLLAWAELACLTAIVAAIAFPKCSTTKECSFGTACVKVPDGVGGYGRPTCEDCYYLVDYAWPHVLPTGRDNASALCRKEIEGERARVMFENTGVSPSFDRCLYALEAASRQSRVTYLVLFIISVLLSLRCCEDRREQMFCQHVRLAALPLRSSTGGWCVRSPGDGARRLAAAVVLLTNNLLQRALGALIPVAMLMLLVSNSRVEFIVMCANSWDPNATRARGRCVASG